MTDHDPIGDAATGPIAGPGRRPTIVVVDMRGAEHPFAGRGLHEDVAFAINEYTGELIVETVGYGPRGTDQWARLGSQVIAAWPARQWRSVTRHAWVDA